MDGLAPLPPPIHINVNVSLDPTLDAHVTALNRAVFGRGFSEVCFEKPSLHIPHITLLRGTLQTADKLRQLREGISAIASSTAPIAFSVGDPHWSLRSGHYIFLTVRPQQAFDELRHHLHRRVGLLLDYGETGGPEGGSHITVGHADSARFSLSELARPSPPGVCIASELRICTSGARGTCTSVISKAPLLGRADPGQPIA